MNEDLRRGEAERIPAVFWVGERQTHKRGLGRKREGGRRNSNVALRCQIPLRVQEKMSTVASTISPTKGSAVFGFQKSQHGKTFKERQKEKWASLLHNCTHWDQHNSCMDFIFHD